MDLHLLRLLHLRRLLHLLRLMHLLREYTVILCFTVRVGKLYRVVVHPVVCPLLPVSKKHFNFNYYRMQQLSVLLKRPNLRTLLPCTGSLAAVATV